MNRATINMFFDDELDELMENKFIFRNRVGGLVEGISCGHGEGRGVICGIGYGDSTSNIRGASRYANGGGSGSLGEGSASINYEGSLLIYE